MTSPHPSTIEMARKILTEGIPFGPRVHPCVCGAGKHLHSGKANTGRCATTGCTRYRADVAWELAYDAYDAQQADLGTLLRQADRIAGAERRRRDPVLPGQWRIGVSDVDTCRRAIWYRNLGPEDMELAWEDKREAMVGTIIHEGAEARMRMVAPWREYEQKVIVPGLDRASRFDWYDPITCEAGDTKTAGDWRWDKLGDDGPDENTWDKVFLYGLTLEESGREVRTVRLDYLKRSNGHDETFVRTYDRKRAEAARDRLVGYAANLDTLAEAPDDAGLRDALMPRDGDGPDRDPLCKRCPFRLDCWNIKKAETAGRSPYSYTMLGPDPADEPIIWAIERRVEAAKAKREAEAAYKETGDLLSGITPGRYGSFEGYEKPGGTGPDWKEYADRVTELYSLPEDQRPPVETIPGPKSRRYTYIQWGPVRKATLEKEARQQRNVGKGES